MKKTMALTMALLMGTAVVMPTAHASWLSKALSRAFDYSDRADYVKSYPNRVEDNLREKQDQLAMNALAAVLSKVYGTPVMTPEAYEAMAASTDYPPGYQPPTMATEEDMAKAEDLMPGIYDFLNEKRGQAGLEPLELEPEWREIAYHKAEQQLVAMTHPEAMDVHAFDKQKTSTDKEEITMTFCTGYTTQMAQYLPTVLSHAVEEPFYAKPMKDPAVNKVAIGIATGRYQSMPMLSIAIILIKPR